MNYPAQTISLQKFLGQLQEGGNVSTLKHYLELLEGAFLIKVLSKYSKGALATRASSPKILPLAPALIHAFQSPDKLQSDPAWRGRVFESVIGAHLAALPGDLYYRSHGKHEVDLVHEYDGVLRDWFLVKIFGLARGFLVLVSFDFYLCCAPRESARVAL